jgi:hypothetical protein
MVAPTTHNIGDGDLNVCSGDVYDSGGTGDYSNSEAITETYCSNAGNCILVTFNNFNPEACCDDLTIYDGPTTGSPIIGTYAGTALPNGGVIASTSGCLTFEFSSDGSIVRAGWDATISCVACPTPTCSDGIQNQGETGIDCGGPCPACPPPSCVDGIQNQGEIGVDCGGPCPACSADIIPTACATQTFNITGNATFYDDGGAGGLPCADGDPNNFANANCETTTTICAPSGQTLLANFNTFAMFNTSSAFDWMKIYEGTGTGGTVLFDNDVGGPNNGPSGGTGSGFGDCGNDDLSVLQGICSNGSNCLTFEFHASGVVNREGWDASMLITNGTTCALPITLINFDGTPFVNRNLLEWSTASEINNDYFILEHSSDGREFEELVQINGAGNSNDILNYSFEHKYPSNIEYYRLKQVDFDGQFSFSKIIVIKSDSAPEINIYPNPAKDNLFFDINLSDDGNYTIVYTSVLGRVIKEKINISAETKKYKANTFSTLSTGVYFIQIRDESNQVLKSQKIIKK